MSRIREMRSFLYARLLFIFSESLFFKRAGLLVAATLAGNAIQLGLTLALSRHFGPILFGQFKTVIGFFGLAVFFADLGMGTTVIKYFSELKKTNPLGLRQLLYYFLKIKLLAYVIVFAAILPFHDFFAAIFLQSQNYSWLFISGFIFFGATYFDLARFVLQGLQKVRVLSIAQFLYSSLSSAFAVAIGWTAGPVGAIAGYGIGILLADIFAATNVLSHEVFHSTKGKLLNGFSVFKAYSLKVYGTSFMGFISLAILPVLNLFFSPTIVGYYGLAYIFYNAALLIPSVTSNVLLPRLSEAAAGKEHHVSRRLLRLILSLYGAVALVGMVLATLLVRPFLNFFLPAYLPAIPIILALIATAFIVGAFIIYSSALYSAARFRRLQLGFVLINALLLAASFASCYWVSR